MAWLRFFAIGWGVPLTVYATLQAGALMTLRGRWRLAAATPIPFMLLISGHMAWAYFRASNLWPLTMLMTAPGASLAVLLLWVIGLLAAGRWKTLLAPAAVCVGALLAAQLSEPGIAILWGGWSVTIAITLLAVAGAASVLARVMAVRRTPAAGPN